MALHPKVQTRLDQLKEAMKVRGWTVDVHQGFRSFDEQDKLYKHGRTTSGKIVTNAKAGDSLHNYGLAGDVVFKMNGKWSWAEHLPWDLLGEVGKSLGFVWGGDFKNIKDRPHFQYTNGLTLDRIKEIYKHYGIRKVWESI